MNHEMHGTDSTSRRDDHEHGESCGTSSSSSQSSKSASSSGGTSGSPSEREETSRQAPGAGDRSESETRHGASTGNKPKTNEGKTGVSGETDEEA